ncbi:MAG: glycine--tRNA ligase subunit beta [Anaerolineales bacterium]|nr:glycine--tRNA ligase subunit beta [Anaerolineales bacterium]
MPKKKKTAARRPLSLQQVILGLQDFWARQGCLIWQPYNIQVGAGTYNPATFLRVLGPEPWKVAYVEPSIRPDDGRYGENPNRLQQHYQYQVILKPDPGDPQDIYLRSLEAIGIDMRENDVRFVEDNWESPALGAWGLGWEVWLNGMEITQFTYFQQAGGIELPIPSVELTYGLERILMALQRNSHFKDIRWVGDVNYGDVLLQNEREQSTYNYEVADVERQRQSYEIFEAEARAALAAGLVIPAHDYVLKCSHAFNILDARGAVGVTERANFFGRMRDLARQVAETYLAGREKEGFPLKGKFLPASKPARAARRTAKGKAPVASQTLLLEIGVEELPASDCLSAREQLAQKLPSALKEARLAYRQVSVCGTPRRIAAIVRGLAPIQEDVEVVVKGPPASKAYQPDGSPSPALAGFAAKNGVNPKSLREENGYIILRRTEKGKAALEILPDLLSGSVSAIQFPKVMRWSESAPAFSRPVRWLTALLGAEPVAVEWDGLRAGRTTRGLRLENSPEIVIPRADEYLKVLRAHGIEPDPAVRAERIAKQAKALAAKRGGEASFEPGLLEEVTDLVESPQVILGAFDPESLSLPREVLISVMRKHQRYFPVQGGGQLLPFFLTVRNGKGEGEANVREGNEHVLRARFADAAFFIREDHRKKLEDFLPLLSTLAFQAKLGSMLDKCGRVERLTEKISPALNLSPGAAGAAKRAAHLCKADLATQMVVEMTSLQGVIGRYYALDSGESAEVAQAVYEHYLPRSAEDAVPESPAGAAVAVADRLDSLAGLFAAGLVPTGTRDPFALRRAALGLIQILLGRGMAFDIREGIRMAASLQPIPVSEETQAQVMEFVAGRLRGVLADQGFRYDVVEAVLAAQASNPVAAQRAAEELAGWVEKPDWPATLAAYARCVRITREQRETFAVDPERLSEPAERALWEACRRAAAEAEKLRNAGALTVDNLMKAFVPHIPVISKFFEDVLVMTDDPAVRNNRLGMLQIIARLPEGVADLSKLEGF